MFKSNAVAVLAACGLASVSAFRGQMSMMAKAPAKKVVAAPVSSFAGGLIGSSVEAPEFDPLSLSAGRSDETIAWYRASELKHGRVCMLACLGLWVQALVHIPDDTFSLGGNAIDALYKVAAERPQAIVQILLAIGAIETVSLNIEGSAPGDLNFDPLGFKLKYDQEDMALKELKNGRAAMIGAAGMLVQNALTGQGVFEQIASGHISPVGDGQGAF
jgi:hypothetical protein